MKHGSTLFAIEYPVDDRFEFTKGRLTWSYKVIIYDVVRKCYVLNSVFAFIFTPSPLKLTCNKQ